MSNNNTSSMSPFFIVGSGRSGSTLLRMILSEHSKIAIPPETWYLSTLLENLPTLSKLTDDEVALAIEIMTSHYRWPDLNVDDDDFKKRILSMPSPTLREIVGVVYQQKLEEEGKVIWGDKTPPYVRIVPQLHNLYPKAKFLYLVRDGRDVSKSFHSKGWHGPWLYKNTNEWKVSVLHYMDLSGVAFASQIMEVRYEDIVLDMEATIKNICEFLEIDYEPTMLQWGASIEDKVPEREAYAHKKLLRKPLPTDINRWKSELTKFEIFIIESFIYNELLMSGYELHFKNYAWRLLFLGTRIFCVLFVPIYSFFSRAALFIWRRARKLFS